MSTIFRSKWRRFLCLLDRFEEIVSVDFNLLLILAIRCALSFDTFLQVRFALSIANAGTIVLVIIGIVAAAFFFIPNFNAALVERCAYQFAPWIVFIIYFWGVVENNWIPKNVRRNNIVAALELLATVISAIGAMVLFTMRYRASKIDPMG